MSTLTAFIHHNTGKYRYCNKKIKIKEEIKSIQIVNEEIKVPISRCYHCLCRKYPGMYKKKKKELLKLVSEFSKVLG